jgi:signal transduction histidine kinase
MPVKPLMQVCADKVAPLQARNRNRLTLSGQDVSVVADAEVLMHIINNLLSNACKFTLEGDITLSWWLEPALLVIQVGDTGCGIPDEFRARIFDAFWQVDMSLSRKYGGYGLGLAIVRQFVQQLGGDITVETNVVKGTLFTVKIPNSAGRLAHLP